MEFIEVFRDEILNCGQTMREVARKLCVAPNTLSTWFKRGFIPEAMTGRVVEIIASPRLSEERCSRCEGNLFPTRYLDNIDDHPIVALDKLVEEAGEMIALSNEARRIMTNRRRGYRFDGADDELLCRLEDEVADLITGSKTLLIKLQEWYGHPVQGVMRRHIAKLERNGYVQPTKNAARAATRTAAR